MTVALIFLLFKDLTLSDMVSDSVGLSDNSIYSLSDNTCFCLPNYHFC